MTTTAGSEYSEIEEPIISLNSVVFMSDKSSLAL